MNNKKLILLSSTFLFLLLFLVGNVFKTSTNQIFSHAVKKETKIKIQDLDNNSIKNLFNSIEPKATIVMLYTSWCKSCIRKFPEIHQIIQKYKNINPIIISLDENKANLQSFLSTQGQINFTPYNISPPHILRLVYELSNKKLHFNGSVPYIAVLDKNMLPVMQGSDIKQINSSIKSLLNEY